MIFLLWLIEFMWKRKNRDPIVRLEICAGRPRAK